MSETRLSEKQSGVALDLKVKVLGIISQTKNKEVGRVVVVVVVVSERGGVMSEMLQVALDQYHIVSEPFLPVDTSGGQDQRFTRLN